MSTGYDLEQKISKGEKDMSQSMPPKRISPFESIRHDGEDGEYWSARELAAILEYSRWQRFEDVVRRAMTACEISGQQVENHFTKVGKMVKLG